MNNAEDVEDIVALALGTTITSEVSSKFLNSFSYIESESDLKKGTMSRLSRTLH